MRTAAVRFSPTAFIAGAAVAVAGMLVGLVAVWHLWGFELCWSVAEPLIP